MAGITDGRLLEDHSVPLAKLEIEVATLAQLNAESVTRAASDGTLQDNIDLVNNTLTSSISNHVSTGISAAHPGAINVEGQVPNGSVNVWKLAFTPATQGDFASHINDTSIHFTLGTGPSQAAQGNHTHDLSNINAHKLDNYHAQDLIDMINSAPGGDGGNIVITGGGVLAAGEGNFAGAGSVTSPIAINPAPGTTNYSVTITPTDAAANLGEVYVSRSVASFTVANTGAYTGGFYWTVNIMGSALPLGTGSGLDADRLDGLEGSSYSLATHDHDGVYSVVAHTHAQSTSHDSPDTDVGAASLHHTIGVGAYQAAAGNHVHAASVVTVTPSGNISSVTVQAAIAELDNDKAAAAHTHGGADVTSAVANAVDSQKLGGALPSAYALTGHNHDLAYSTASHTHTQAQSHGSPDTDVDVESIHHTIGTSATQAAAGDHGHGFIPAAGQRGVAQFAGTGAETEITFTPAATGTGYFVGIMPIGADPAVVGSFSVEVIDSDTFKVYNTGTNAAQFAWMVLK